MTSDTTGTVQSKGLLARAVGILTSPRATYADVIVRPRPWGALLLVFFVIAIPTFLFLSTEVGQNAMIDQNLSWIESFGGTPNEAMIANMERSAGRAPYFAVISQAIFIPIFTALFAGIALAVFNALLGGDATFKQVFAVIAYSSFVSALATLFIMPLNYVRETMSSATSLSVFFPMVDSTTFLGMLLGSIDLFRIWWIITLSIGLGVLYRRRTGPIAWGILIAYVAIALCIAAVRAALSGA